MNTVAVQKRTTVPLPWVKSTNFSPSEHYVSEDYGEIRMSFIRGSTLESKWDTLDQESKEAVCREIWDIVWRIRDIERTDLVGGLYQCAADGTPSKGILEDLQKPARPLTSDEEVRARLYERYLHAGGRVLRDLLPELLPRSDRSVFTHGDIALWNIMIDDQNKITGILGWKFAGWSRLLGVRADHETFRSLTGRSGWNGLRLIDGISTGLMLSRDRVQDLMRRP